MGLEEKILIQDLEKIKLSFKPETEQDGLEKMKAREAKFLKDLEVVFKNRANVDRFLKFKRSFYQRNQAYLSSSS